MSTQRRGELPYARGVESDAELVPSPAATVVLLRAANGGARDDFEVLLLRRSSQLVFYGGAWVFPGGRIDAADTADDPGDLHAAAARAAIRELAEETGLALAASELVHFARWITPKGRARRFDAFYFAAYAPGGKVQVDQGEVDAYRWMRPADALAASAARQIELPPPTFVTLTQLALHADAPAVIDALRRRSPERYEPRPCQMGDSLVYLYEGDAGYAACEPASVGPRHRLVALDGAFRYERS